MNDGRSALTQALILTRPTDASVEPNLPIGSCGGSEGGAWARRGDAWAVMTEGGEGRKGRLEAKEGVGVLGGNAAVCRVWLW